ncbi:hypothetical protein [Natrialba asiatica]|uniref:Uncharacterized protein n=1 Tax=Natrialba asiatica (strain ATCC 700177 / DSM 12278 / JCM 9576 / FERM P-10747 / NBRC 102637 / 172P1) TaxID=29540 RepID=M0AF30_NATA1|nr:hypothetical protein [Natrialba asiatica]ELY97139.1 hypothetical protein C481_21161 [Natrialba asiatica DSM 12278]
MGDEPVGDEDDEDVSVTVKMPKSELDELGERFGDEYNNAARLRRAAWLVNNASSLTINFNTDENESE